MLYKLQEDKEQVPNKKFSDEVEKLRKSRRDQEDARRAKEEHPDGFTPGVHLKNGEGTLTTKGNKKKVESNDEWAAHLEYFGFNPEEFEVIDNKIEYRCWEAPVDGGKQMMHYYKVGIRSKQDTNVSFDFDWIKKLITKKISLPKREKATQSFVLALTDWQVGKQDGDGVEGIVHRVNEMIGQTKALINARKKGGAKYNRLIICGLGDIVEGCDGHYAMQTSSVEINQRDQITVATGLIVKVVTELAPLFPFTTIAVVGGNHGENRKNGKAFTDFGDNFDNLAFDQAERIVSQNKQLAKNISWNIADKDLTMTLEIENHILGIAHGHQFRTGGTNHPAKAGNWLAKQALAKTAIGGCDILLSAHFHHHSTEHQRNTTLVQAPALDGGSLWIENSHALTSKAGVLTFVIDNKWGYTDEKVLHGTTVE